MYEYEQTILLAMSLCCCLKDLYIFNCEKEKLSCMQRKRATSVWYMAKYKLSCFIINRKSI